MKIRMGKIAFRPIRYQTYRISEVTVVATENNCHINMILGRRRSRGLVPTVTT